jgi:Zn-dependent oligopeptidase
MGKIFKILTTNFLKKSIAQANVKSLYVVKGGVVKRSIYARRRIDDMSTGSGGAPGPVSQGPLRGLGLRPVPVTALPARTSSTMDRLPAVAKKKVALERAEVAAGMADEDAARAGLSAPPVIVEEGKGEENGLPASTGGLSMPPVIVEEAAAAPAEDKAAETPVQEKPAVAVAPLVAPSSKPAPPPPAAATKPPPQGLLAASEFAEAAVPAPTEDPAIIHVYITRLLELYPVHEPLRAKLAPARASCKQAIRNYEKAFEAQNGRAPETADKQPIKFLYKDDKELKKAIEEAPPADRSAAEAEGSPAPAAQPAQPTQPAPLGKPPRAPAAASAPPPKAVQDFLALAAPQEEPAGAVEGESDFQVLHEYVERLVAMYREHPGEALRAKAETTHGTCKRMIRRWEANFEKSNGRAPADADKAAIAYLYADERELKRISEDGRGEEAAAVEAVEAPPGPMPESAEPTPALLGYANDVAARAESGKNRELVAPTRTAVKKAIRSWEKSFAESNGREPSNDEKKAHMKDWFAVEKRLKALEGESVASPPPKPAPPPPKPEPVTAAPAEAAALGPVPEGEPTPALLGYANDVAARAESGKNRELVAPTRTAVKKAIRSWEKSFAESNGREPSNDDKKAQMKDWFAVEKRLKALEGEAAPETPAPAVAAPPPKPAPPPPKPTEAAASPAPAPATDAALGPVPEGEPTPALLGYANDVAARAESGKNKELVAPTRTAVKKAIRTWEKSFAESNGREPSNDDKKAQMKDWFAVEKRLKALEGEAAPETPAAPPAVAAPPPKPAPETPAAAVATPPPKPAPETPAASVAAPPPKPAPSPAPAPATEAALGPVPDGEPTPALLGYANDVAARAEGGKNRELVAPTRTAVKKAIRSWEKSFAESNGREPSNDDKKAQMKDWFAVEKRLKALEGEAAPETPAAPPAVAAPPPKPAPPPPKPTEAAASPAPAPASDAALGPVPEGEPTPALLGYANDVAARAEGGKNKELVAPTRTAVKKAIRSWEKSFAESNGREPSNDDKKSQMKDWFAVEKRLKALEGGADPAPPETPSKPAAAAAPPKSAGPVPEGEPTPELLAYAADIATRAEAGADKALVAPTRSAVKKAIRSWEKSFAAANGREPNNDDKKSQMKDWFAVEKRLKALEGGADSAAAPETPAKPTEATPAPAATPAAAPAPAGPGPVPEGEPTPELLAYAADIATRAEAGTNKELVAPTRSAVKKAIRSWEKSFASTNGREPSNDDKKAQMREWFAVEKRLKTLEG